MYKKDIQPDVTVYPFFINNAERRTNGNAACVL